MTPHSVGAGTKPYGESHSKQSPLAQLNPSCSFFAECALALEAQAKESRLFTLLDGLAVLKKDSEFVKLLETERIGKGPELSSTRNGTSTH
jgi:hypothetical protein